MRRHLGFTLLETIIVVAILGSVASVILAIYSRYQLQADANRVAAAMIDVGTAADKYTQRFGVDIARGLSIPVGTTTVANPLSPTVAELQALGYVVPSNVVLAGRSTGFSVSLFALPVGCAPTACTYYQITSATQPWLDSRAPGNPPNMEQLNRTLEAMNGRGLISTLDAPGAFTGLAGTYTAVNPYGAAGHLAYYSPIDGGLNPAYARRVDDRPIQFDGGLSVRGSSGGSTTTLNVSGLLGTYHPTTGAISVVLGTDGSITSYSAAGAAQAGVTSAGVLYGTGLNVNGNATISGTATVGSLIINNPQTVGAACASNQYGRDADGRFLQCVNNVWQIAGMGTATLGAACTEGLALNAADRSRPLICRGGFWRSLNEALGRSAGFELTNVTDGTNVVAPTCVGGGPAILLVPSILQASTSTATSFSAVAVGPIASPTSWNVVTTGPPGSQAVALTFCQASAI